MTRTFRQVDVFSSEPMLGNPVAVVHDADGLTEDQMAAFARWTNLSETTFLLSPTDPAADAASVLALRPDQAALPTKIGVVGAYADGECAIEVRAFCRPEQGVVEDPVTGSLNAALGQWLAGTKLPDEYVASQGTALGRRGRVSVRRIGDEVWVGGATNTTIVGEVGL